MGTHVYGRGGLPPSSFSLHLMEEKKVNNFLMVCLMSHKHAQYK